MEDVSPPPLNFAEQESIFLKNIRPDPAAGVAQLEVEIVPAAKITEQEIEAWKEQDVSGIGLGCPVRARPDARMLGSTSAFCPSPTLEGS